MEPIAKAIQLSILVYFNIHNGITYSVIGPTLPDLQCLFHVQIGEVASLFLVFGLAIAGSCLISTFLIKMINMYILMAGIMLIYSTGIGFVTVTPYIYVAWVGFFATGLAQGVFFVCSLVICSIFHKGEAYAWHIQATGAALGSFLGPLIAKPFIGTTDPSVSTDIVSLGNLNNTSSANLSRNVSLYCESTISNVEVLYLTIGILALPISFSFCLFYLMVKPKVDFVNVPSTNLCQIDTSGKTMTKTAYMLVVFLSFPMSYGLAFTYGSYLTTIGVESSLKFNVQKSALLTSIFWLMFVIGRVTASGISNHIEQQTIMYICLTGQLVSAGVLCMYETLGELGFWIGSLALAFMSGPNYACLVAWSGDYITQTPTILSIYCIMDFSGSSFLPYTSGILISVYGQNAHVYFVFALCVLELFLFVTAHCLGTKLARETEDADSDTRVLANNEKEYGSLNDNVQHDNK